jgi:signal transduction histidine kinase
VTLGSDETLDTSTLLAEAESSAEHAKSTPARQLHDELGGLLLAALMDTGWVEHHIALAPDIRSRLRRIKDVLSLAIDHQRWLVEELRPSLLDTMGLFAALRWHHRKTCKDASLTCSDSYGHDEPRLSAVIATALFRIIQTALLAATRQPSATRLHLGVVYWDGVLSIDVHHDGDRLTSQHRDQADVVSFWLLEHRVRALGGRLSISCPLTGGMRLAAEIPLQDTPSERASGVAPRPDGSTTG